MTLHEDCAYFSQIYEAWFMKIYEDICKTIILFLFLLFSFQKCNLLSEKELVPIYFETCTLFHFQTTLLVG